MNVSECIKRLQNCSSAEVYIQEVIYSMYHLPAANSSKGQEIFKGKYLSHKCLTDDAKNGLYSCIKITTLKCEGFYGRASCSLE